MGLAKTGLKLILLCALFIPAACCRPAASLIPSKKSAAKPPADCWLLKPVSYQLRHSAELKFRNKQQFLEGFMELDLRRRQARLAIFTGLGVTLLNLEIKPQSFSFTDSGPHNRKEKRFAAAVAGAVGKIFFSLGDYQQGKSEITVKFRPGPEGTELYKIGTQPAASGWEVTYADYHNYNCARLPRRIVLRNNRPKFKLTLRLLTADILKK